MNANAVKGSFYQQVLPLFTLCKFFDRLIAQLQQLPPELPTDDLGRSRFMLALAQVLITLGLEGNKMFNSHKFPSIYYGLLHSDSPPWNAYDHGPPR